MGQAAAAGQQGGGGVEAGGDGGAGRFKGGGGRGAGNNKQGSSGKQKAHILYVVYMTYTTDAAVSSNRLFNQCVYLRIYLFVILLC